MSEQHRFDCTLKWTGAQRAEFSYDTFSRDLELRFPEKGPLAMSSAASFKGDAARTNPEDLLIGALSTCHALTYLAVAARSRIEVLAYEDDASGILSNAPVGAEARDRGPMRFTEATLRPRVTVRAGTDLEKARALHDKAHKNCFIAQSIAFPVHIEPIILEG